MCVRETIRAPLCVCMCVICDHGISRAMCDPGISRAISDREERKGVGQGHQRAGGLWWPASGSTSVTTVPIPHPGKHIWLSTFALTLAKGHMLVHTVLHDLFRRAHSTVTFAPIRGRNHTSVRSVPRVLHRRLILGVIYVLTGGKMHLLISFLNLFKYLIHILKRISGSC